MLLSVDDVAAVPPPRPEGEGFFSTPLPEEGFFRSKDFWGFRRGGAESLSCLWRKGMGKRAI